MRLQVATGTRIANRLLGFLRRHPVFFLLLLTPGIPEYISGSSPLITLILNPFQFFLQIIINLALYGPGVLLIREAKIRWEKGWATVLLLGAAYGILEEGIALSTLYNSSAAPVGTLGYYGHWLGVNWVWTPGVVAFHMIFSISLPILLLGLALPETERRSFLSERQIKISFAILASDVSLLALFISFDEDFWMGWPIFFGSLCVVGVFILFARVVRRDTFRSKKELGRNNLKIPLLIGLLYYPSMLLIQFGGMTGGLPALFDFLLLILVEASFLIYILRNLDRKDNERNLILLSLGLVLPMALFGVLLQVTLPLSLMLDLIIILFFRKLWKKYNEAVAVSIPFSNEKVA